MHKSNLTDGSAIEVDIEIKNFPVGIIEIQIEFKFNKYASCPDWRISPHADRRHRKYTVSGKK